MKTMIKVYLVAGAELHEGIAAVLKKNGFDLIGREYTMDAAVVALRKMPLNPDLFIINGLAQASGASGGVINRNRSLLVKLKEIRMAAPRSRILLLLPGENPPELILNIITLGIYDIRQTSRFDGPALLEWIENPMSIADFKDFQTGQVPDNDPGEIRYDDREEGDKQKPFLKKALASFQPGKGLVSKVSGSFRQGGAVAGRLKAVLGVGEARIEKWIVASFSDFIEIVWSSSDPEEIREKIEYMNPDICIFMRQGACGGIPGAAELASRAAGLAPAVLFIAGELDGAGREMISRAAGAGVRHIISCEIGGYISGDELAYVLTGMIREFEDSGRRRGEETVPDSNGEGKKAIGILLQGAGTLARALKQPAPAAGAAGKKQPGKRIKRRIAMSEGLPLEEGMPPGEKAISPENPTAIVPGGILAVVSPWRPSLAGRLAAQAVKILGAVEGSEVAYVGGSRNSTGAVWLDIPDEELIVSDWRVPGSNCPVVRDNIRIWGVDPVKDLPLGGGFDLWSIVKQARKGSTYTVVDFAGEISEVRRASHLGLSVVLVILPGSDPVELKISRFWLNNLTDGRQNIVSGIDLRGDTRGIPEGLRPKVVIRNNPADALGMVLKNNINGEFIWN